MNRQLAKKHENYKLLNNSVSVSKEVELEDISLFSQSKSNFEKSSVCNILDYDIDWFNSDEE